MVRRRLPRFSYFKQPPVQESLVLRAYCSLRRDKTSSSGTYGWDSQKILQTRVGPDHQLQDLPSLAVIPALTSRTPAQRRCIPRNRDLWKEKFPVLQFSRSHSQAKHGQTKRSQPSGLKAHEHSLFSNSIIRCGRDGLLPCVDSKDEKDRVTSAGTFFSTAHEFLYSAGSFRDHPINTLIPEIVVLGASNVGKSSFLNALMGKSDMARVSQRPGHTTTMNAFGVGPMPMISSDLVPRGATRPRHSLVVMDTPGYGFRSQSDWGQSILKYLQGRRMLRGAVLLLSSEKRLQDLDKWILSTLAESNTRTLVVLTKADKSKQDWPAQCSQLAHKARSEMLELENRVGNGWKEGAGWSSEILITAADMGSVRSVGCGAGMGGARVAVLEMAGFNLGRTVEQKPEDISYTGPVIPFEDISWKK